MQQNKAKKGPDKSEKDPAMSEEGEGRALLKERLFQRSTSIEPVPKTPDVDVSYRLHAVLSIYLVYNVGIPLVWCSC